MEKKKYLKLSSLNAYKISFHLSNYVWDIVDDWDYFAKDTVGKQFTRAIDSISANIAEGFGRHYKKDKVKFYNYAFASTQESFDWNEKSCRRKLLSKDQYNHIYSELQKLPKEVNHLSNFTNRKLSK